MRKLITPVAAAALVVAGLDAAPAKAQFVITSGHFTQGYSGGYSPYSDGGTRIVIVGGGAGFGDYPAYPGYISRPSYGGSYGPYHGGRLSPYYGGGHPVYIGGGYTNYPGDYRVRYSSGWRR